MLTKSLLKPVNFLRKIMVDVEETTEAFMYGFLAVVEDVKKIFEGVW